MVLSEGQVLIPEKREVFFFFFLVSYFAHQKLFISINQNTTWLQQDLPEHGWEVTEHQSTNARQVLGRKSGDAILTLYALCVSVRRELSSVGLRRGSGAAVQRCPPAPALRARGPRWGWGSARGADAGAQSRWVHVLICELKKPTCLSSRGSGALVVAGARSQGGNYIEMRQQSPQMHIAVGVGAEHHVPCFFKLCTLCTLCSISFSPGNRNRTMEGLKPNAHLLMSADGSLVLLTYALWFLY